MSARSLLLLSLSNFLGGTSYVATGYALEGFAPMALVFWRTVAGSLVLVPLAWRAAGGLRVERGDWLRMAAVGVFGYAAPLLVGTAGQALSSATNASLLVGVEPVTIVVLSALFLGEPLTPLKAGAVASGIAGASVIVLQGVPFYGAAVTPHLRGDLLLFAHGFAFALYSVIGKPVLRRVPPMVFTGATTAFALPPMALAAAAGPLWAGGPSPASVGGLAYLALGVTVLGTITWNEAMRDAPASALANFVFVQPLVGVLLGALLQGDRLTAWSALGGGLILLGVYGSTRSGNTS